MEKTTITAQLPALLLPWYKENHRDLPWRNTRDPYRIWLSEIMLQQTRVEAVKGYYSRFLEVLPTVEALAQCDDGLLHKLWEGLGYYSRVRNLKKAARVIVEDHGGIFPNSYADVLALPGIGDYTAGAICSIAFGQQTPAVDGNVMRVAARLLDNPTPIDLPVFKSAVREQLSAIYPKEAGTFSQALMELGATVCGPNRKPECGNCPCNTICLGYQRGTAESLPMKLPKREKRSENRTVFIVSCNGKFALHKRPEKGLLAGLWEFPNIPGHFETSDSLKAAEKLGLLPRELFREVGKKHIFTHIVWNMRGIYLEVSQQAPDFVWMTPEEINTGAALPTAFRQFWEEVKYV